MFDARERPRGRNDKGAHILPNDQLPIHFRKNDQLHASVPASAREVANLKQVGLWIAERTRNLSSRNLHMNPPTKHTKGRENSYMVIKRLFSLGAFCVFGG